MTSDIGLAFEAVVTLTGAWFFLSWCYKNSSKPESWETHLGVEAKYEFDADAGLWCGYIELYDLRAYGRTPERASKNLYKVLSKYIALQIAQFTVPIALGELFRYLGSTLTKKNNT